MDVRLAAKVHAPLKILAVVQVLAERGIRAGDVLAGSGLGVDQVRNPDVRTSVQQLLTVGRNAVRLSADPSLGLLVGQRLHISSYGLYGYAMLCAKTMRRALELSIRYRELAAVVMPFSLSERDEAAVLRLPTRDELGDLDLGPRAHGFFLDMQFALHGTLARDVMGPWCVPATVFYGLPAPAHAEQIERALECPVVFGHAGNEIHYPREWLDRAPRLANPITAAQMSASCERLVQQALR